MEQSIEIVKNWDLKKLIEELEAGHIKIPRFQRDYIWERSKTVKLLNSIYLKYPIGSFFLWIAPKKYNNFIRDIFYFMTNQYDKIKIILIYKSSYFTMIFFRFNSQLKHIS